MIWYTYAEPSWKSLHKSFFYGAQSGMRKVSASSIYRLEVGFSYLLGFPPLQAQTFPFFKLKLAKCHKTNKNSVLRYRGKTRLNKIFTLFDGGSGNRCRSMDFKQTFITFTALKLLFLSSKLSVSNKKASKVYLLRFLGRTQKLKGQRWRALFRSLTLTGELGRIS